MPRAARQADGVGTKAGWLSTFVWLNPCQGRFFQGKVGMEVGLCRLDRLMAEPQCDNTASVASNPAGRTVSRNAPTTAASMTLATNDWHMASAWQVWADRHS